MLSRMLTKLEIQGFKSIKNLPSLEFAPANILIGANGAGKSNFISFFKLLNWMIRGNLQEYVGKLGYANSILHDGAMVTTQISAKLTIQATAGINEYYIRLAHAASDTLIFVEENLRYTPRGSENERNWQRFESGRREAQIIDAAATQQTARVILSLLKQCIVYQFHNTSETARVRQRWDIQDNRYLKEDGANLAPFLLRLRETKPQYYTRIVETIRQIAPFFADFVLEPVGNWVLLQWRERGTDLIFGSHQASDGTLRVMALVALLLQPENELPMVIILDEPELGLHPYAINVLAGLLKSVSINTQVILATQSTNLLDHFEPNQIIVVDRPGRESLFKHLDEERLKDWLDEYSIAELWEKNVLGGRPS